MASEAHQTNFEMLDLLSSAERGWLPILWRDLGERPPRHHGGSLCHQPVFGRDVILKLASIFYVNLLISNFSFRNDFSDTRVSLGDHDLSREVDFYSNVGG